MEWEVKTAHHTCDYGTSLRLDRLTHGTTWFGYYSQDHDVALFPQWGTEVEHGPLGNRRTEVLGGYTPYGPGYGQSYGYTTDIYGCHTPSYTQDLTEDNCGNVGRSFTDPRFTTYGVMWCYESPGTWCEPSWRYIDVTWSR